MQIGYVRVSTRDQKPYLQMDALREAGCERIFEETASGTKRDRPELVAAYDYMRSGDTLVVWKLDRLARSTRQLLETVEALEQRGIGLKILTQNMDTTSAGGRLIFTVFSAIAEFEREIICERTRAGLDAARFRGRKGGRPRALSEKDLKQARALLTDPEITVEDVARRHGVGPSTLYRYLPAARQSVQGDGN
ncbi:recombinase family protein [Desulfovibrio sp. TomC]|uniref:recombinase family protein n=1 Tax=Desulfovibrio sp. TomC TaxID=1562888 RepID=UPI000574123B|nr:recombinase family protein [Desulfovibrio sp. TomC]KHK00167.1 Phage DNA invertase [Desulfovibrio sp. TomC]